MPRYVLIQETTGHACYVTTEEMRALIDIRSNPGGYTDVDRCLAMIQNPEAAYVAFPLGGPMGKMTIHVDGRMDFMNRFVWKEPGHRCGPRCLLETSACGQRRS
jgi:hypothetical protein